MKAEKVSILREKVIRISQFLRYKTHIKPRGHAKLSNIRSYLLKLKLATRAQLKTITEVNVVEKWNEFHGDMEFLSDSETEFLTDANSN